MKTIVNKELVAKIVELVGEKAYNFPYNDPEVDAFEKGCIQGLNEAMDLIYFEFEGLVLDLFER